VERSRLAFFSSLSGVRARRAALSELPNSSQEAPGMLSGLLKVRSADLLRS